MIKRGLLTFERQQSSELSYRVDGYIDGQLSFVFDYATQLATMRGFLGSSHPDEPNVFLHDLRVEKLRTGRGRATFECMGLFRDPTIRIVQGMPQVSTTPIEAHPKFTSTLAGTPDAPLNGAIFDEDTGEFIGFGDGDLIGVKSFYDGGVMLRATYFTARPPTLSQAFKITKSVPNAPQVPGVSGWLTMPSTFDPIPNTPFYRVTDDFNPITSLTAANLVYGS
jgi:hypothetical protein